MTKEAIDSPMYLMIGTRPDFALAARKPGQCFSSPKSVSWNAMKQVLRYKTQLVIWESVIQGLVMLINVELVTLVGLFKQKVEG